LDNPGLIFKEIEEPKDLCCPITNKLFLSPVSADDGHIYEKEAIEQWVNEKGCSPTFEKISLQNIVPSNLHISKVIEFREKRFKKIIYFVELMIEEEDLGDTLEKLLVIAEEDSKFLEGKTQFVNALKSYVNLRKNNLYLETPMSDLESLFKNLVKYKKYLQAVDVGDEIIDRYENEGYPPEKMEWILKHLILITKNVEEKKRYKLKLYRIYTSGNNWEALQSAIVDHTSNLIEQEDSREAVKSGLSELMNLFKVEINQVKMDILNEVNGKLKEKGMNPITLPERKGINTYLINDLEENNDNENGNIDNNHDNGNINNEVNHTEVVNTEDVGNRQVVDIGIDVGVVITTNY